MTNQQPAFHSNNIRKRIHPRVDVDLKTDFQVLPQGKGNLTSFQRFNTTTKTLGTGGVMFISNVPLKVGTKLDMKLHYNAITVEFVAEIVWTKEKEETGKSEYYCGSKYSAVSYDNITHIQSILRSHQVH